MIETQTKLKAIADYLADWLEKERRMMRELGALDREGAADPAKARRRREIEAQLRLVRMEALSFVNRAIDSL